MFGDHEQTKDPELSLGKDSLLDHTGSSDDDEAMINDMDTQGATIRYKTLTWQRAAFLLFSEYICLAIMSFPWAYSVLGLVPGILITIFITFTTWYTGLTITDYTIAHPGLTDVCDLGKHLFWNSKVVWWITAACFVANNIILAALHVLVGARYFNTITKNYEGGLINTCSLAFAVLATVLCCFLSLPRTFSQLSWVGLFSAGTQFVSVILAMIFAGIQEHPHSYDGTPVTWKVRADPRPGSLWPHSGNPYPTAMTAVLNITYTLVGQITYPSFIHQMKKPQDFKKAVTVVSVCELVLFVLVGSIVYVYVGDYYMTTPAYASLTGNYLYISFSFALPTLIFLGSLYTNVTSQFLMQFIFPKGSRNLHSNTFLGWGVWIGIVFACWALAFVIAEVIPFFSDLESIMSSLFDCWFGFVFWGAAYFQLRKNRPKKPYTFILDAFNVVLIVMGFYFFGPGVYSTVQSIVWNYQSGSYGNPFSCASTAITPE